MKGYVVFCIVLVLVKNIESNDEDIDTVKVINKQYETYKNVCMKQIDLSERDRTIFEADRLPETEEGKCMIACMMSLYGLLEDGRFSREGADRVAELFYPDDPETVARTKEINRKCEKQLFEAKIEDECELAYAAFKCDRLHDKRSEIKI